MLIIIPSECPHSPRALSRCHFLLLIESLGTLLSIIVFFVLIGLYYVALSLSEEPDLHISPRAIMFMLLPIGTALVKFTTSVRFNSLNKQKLIEQNLPDLLDMSGDGTQSSPEVPACTRP